MIMSDNMTRLYFLPAEPWGPVCSPGCWTPWSSRLRYRAQFLRNWNIKKRNQIEKKLKKVFKSKVFLSGGFMFLMWGCLHVWGDEVVLVDADLQVGLHSCFIYGNIPLDGSLEESHDNLNLDFNGLPCLRSLKWNNFPLIDSISRTDKCDFNLLIYWPAPSASPVYGSEQSLWAPGADRIPGRKRKC